MLNKLEFFSHKVNIDCNHHSKYRNKGSLEQATGMKKYLLTSGNIHVLPVHKPTSAVIKVLEWHFDVLKFRNVFLTLEN